MAYDPHSDTLRFLSELCKTHHAELLLLDVVQDSRGHPEAVHIWFLKEATVWLYQCIIDPHCNHFVIELSAGQYVYIIANHRSIFSEASIIEYEGTGAKEAFKSWLEEIAKNT